MTGKQVITWTKQSVWLNCVQSSNVV